MTTVIRAVGANFSNTNLPQLPTLITDGLVAAFRPSNAPDGMTDLSGNGTALTKVGSPVLTATGLQGDILNGYATNLIETLSYTFITVHKVTAVSGDKKSIPLGVFSPTDLYGGAIYVDDNNNLATKMYVFVVKGTQIEKKLSLGSSPDSYVFTAFVVDAVNNTITAYRPKDGKIVTLSTPTGAGSVATRYRDSTIKVGLIQNSSPLIAAWTGKVDLSEALVYDKALTAEQIMAQYQYSKLFMLNKRGIQI